MVKVSTFLPWDCRNLTKGKVYLHPLQWWAEAASPGGDRVKVSKNLGATSVAPVAPVVKSLEFWKEVGEKIQF